MRRYAVVVVIVGLACYASLATVAAGWLNLERRSREELLQKLALVRPGVHILEIGGQLGQPMREWSNADDVLAWGRMKDESFCAGKRLSRFYASTPPCRVVDVYTDVNGTVVYATWTGL